MRLFTAFENKSSILFVELQFLGFFFLHESAGLVSLPEQETSKVWRRCFVHSHLESHWIFPIETPSHRSQSDVQTAKITRLRLVSTAAT